MSAKLRQKKLWSSTCMQWTYTFLFARGHSGYRRPATDRSGAVESCISTIPANDLWNYRARRTGDNPGVDEKTVVNNLSRKRESGECEKCKNIFRRALRLPVHIGEKGSVQESVKSRYENVNFLICTAGEYSWLWDLAKIQISYLSLHLNTASTCIVCGFSTIQATNLCKHTARHTGDKPREGG